MATIFIIVVIIFVILYLATKWKDSEVTSAVNQEKIKNLENEYKSEKRISANDPYELNELKKYYERENKNLKLETENKKNDYKESLNNTGMFIVLGALFLFISWVIYSLVFG